MRETLSQVSHNTSWEDPGRDGFIEVAEKGKTSAYAASFILLANYHRNGEGGPEYIGS